MSTRVISKYNTSDSLMALFSGNHANPPDHKWHSMRRKSSTKIKFYKGHRSLSREKSVFSKIYTHEDKNFHLQCSLKHTRECQPHYCSVLSDRSMSSPPSKPLQFSLSSKNFFCPPFCEEILDIYNAHVIGFPQG